MCYQFDNIRFKNPALDFNSFIDCVNLSISAIHTHIVHISHSALSYIRAFHMDNTINCYIQFVNHHFLKMKIQEKMYDAKIELITAVVFSFSEVIDWSDVENDFR